MHLEAICRDVQYVSHCLKLRHKKSRNVCIRWKCGEITVFNRFVQNYCSAGLSAALLAAAAAAAAAV